MKGHITKRGKNSWSIVLDLGRDANGKRRQKWHTVHGKKDAAEREMARLIHTLSTGEYVEPSRMTVGDYLKRWLADYAKPNVSSRTYDGYYDIIHGHIIPAIGHHALAKLKPLQIQAHYTAALESGRKDKSGGLSAQTVLHHHRVLREALQQAIRWKLLVWNPADAVEPPRAVRVEMSALDENETATLLAAAAETEMYLPVLLAVSTGLRRGELLGLRWADVELDAGRLSVRRSLEQTRSGLNFKQPKTKKSSRTITLPTVTVEALRRHRVAQAKNRLQLGPAYKDGDLVCCNSDGAPWKPDSFTRAFIQLVRSNNMAHIRLHDLRHSHATQLIKQGVHVKVVSERLGHAGIAITLDTYSHVLPSMQETAAKSFDDALRLAMLQQATKK